MSFRKHLLVGLIVGAVVLGPTTSAADAAGGSQVTIDKIGDPTWKPVDFNVFSGPIGTDLEGTENDYADYLPTVLSTLANPNDPTPNHEAHPQLGVGPGEPHSPPYRHELSRGVRRAGFASGRCFTPDEFSTGDAVIAAWMVVPRHGRPAGSSPDFDRGPIIPSAAFPIHVEGVSYRDGEVFDQLLVNFDVPALDDPEDPWFPVDGHSHFPVFLADSADFQNPGPPVSDLRGRYVYKLTMTDSTGAGWKIVVSFTVRNHC